MQRTWSSDSFRSQETEWILDISGHRESYYIYIHTMYYNMIKTKFINNPLVITIFIGAMVTIPSQGAVYFPLSSTYIAVENFVDLHHLWVHPLVASGDSVGRQLGDLQRLGDCRLRPNPAGCSMARCKSPGETPNLAFWCVSSNHWWFQVDLNLTSICWVLTWFFYV